MSALPDVRPALVECEAVIERGLATFVEVGAAMLRIRDERLYRDDFGTFEDYCRERWGFERRHAYRLMDAADVCVQLDTPPANESVARELAPLRDEPETLRETWAEVVDLHGDKPTAAQVREVVETKRPHVSNNAGDNEWYTPSEYISAAHAVMGAIDLDPASTPTANTVVGAHKFYTAEDDGLAHPWQGRVWMNPPYAWPLIDKFCTKLAEAYASGDVTQAITLTNNGTETNWFRTLVGAGAAVAFPLQRVKFWHPGKEAAPLQGQGIVYLGPNVDGFRSRYAGLAWTAAL